MQMKQILTFTHICMSILFFFIFLFSNGASGTTITVVNDCGFTVWPGIYGDPVPNITGFELTPGNLRSFQPPDIWSGSLWGRTGCTFNGLTGHGSCKIGDCDSGRMECNGSSPTPPITVAKFNLVDNLRDEFDVSLTDGYNLPMTIEATGERDSSLPGCEKRGCKYDLNKRCPEELMLKGGGGCHTPCQVSATSQYCCDNSLTSCEPSDYYRLFRSACPRATFSGYEYDYTSCSGFNYTVRFCPPHNAFSTIKVSDQLDGYGPLFSVSGNFSLGFFGEINRYMGIWYTYDAKAQKVWVANPNNPFLHTSNIALSIDRTTGDLIITDEGGTLMKITDVQAGPNPNVTATLEDTGNFRLINELDKKVLWQSFDHPTNALLPGASYRTITVVNECGFTVWPGIYSSHFLNNITGFELAQGNSRSFQTPDDWSGRLWGRTDCTFNGLTGHGWCKVGDCGSGRTECNGRSPTPPITDVKFDLMKGYSDKYDVSLTNGYNLPMIVEATGGTTVSEHGCEKRGCTNDLNKKCPEELMLKGGGGCHTPCQLFPSPEYCCNSSVSTCEPTAYSRLFTSVCPRSAVIESEYTSCLGANYTVRFCPPHNAISTVKASNQLNQYDQLVSTSGKFTLGFFGEDNRYMGIWYTGDAEARKVWVANPINPILYTSDTIELSITDEGETRMKLTDVQAGPKPNVIATLEDTGNFCLVDENDNSVLWQSFDHPTNVLLPGMKLGYDKRTGQNWTLTSWLTDDIFDSGAFTLSWEPINRTAHGLMIRRRGQPYWTSGVIEVNSFQYMSLFYGDNQAKYILTYVYNNEQKYFSYIDAPHYQNMTDPFPMWILTRKGQITKYNSSEVLTPELCYGYNSSHGCMESSVPRCRIEHNYFSQRNGEFSPQKTKNITDSNSSISISDCFVRCWNDCSCAGFGSSNSNGTGCVIWRGSIYSFADGGRNSTMKYVIDSQIPYNPSTSKNMKPIWALVLVPLFLGLGLSWYMKMRKQKRKEYKRRMRDEYFLELAASESFKDVHQLESDGRYGDLLLFSFASIMAATRDFSVEYKLGQGGFGPVYKGKLDDGSEIAIKRLSRSSGQGLVEFKNELILIAKLQHTNLVRIRGCCIHKEEKMLVYEYMPNKSLDFFLFDEKRKAELDWPKRYNIIEGIAQGLLYLHKYSRMRVIHRDLKSNNILLDESMNPKISDFGMARIFDQNEIQATTNRVVGTYGYMAPEYAMEGTFSIKSDIYSFGVLILEIVSGRRNSSFVYLDRTYNLLGYAWELWQQGNAIDLEDPAIGSTCVEHQFLRTVQVALLCVQESAMDRPTTSDMISMLLSDTILLPPPKRPAFFTHRGELNLSLDQIKPKDCSVYNTTFSAMQGR